MNKSLRKAVIAGNWKMNKTPAETKEIITAMKPLVAGADCDVVLCVPYIDIFAAQEAAAGSNIKIGAENCHWAESGAFTAEVSAPMLKSIGVEYVIIGHSERRQYFGETDVTVNKRVRAALNSGLTVILCVGELLEEREQGITEETVRLQTKIALQGVTADELKNIIIAYEPVWAIGTGKTPTAEDVEEVHAQVRKVLAKKLGKAQANKMRILYGGSVKPSNAKEFLSLPDVDGALIGGASLKSADFMAIADNASC
jgi:triosephosphate isomerase